MRYLLALLLLVLPDLAMAQAPCDHMTPFKHINATGPVAIVPGVPGKRIYFCGFTITQKGNTLDLRLFTGTGTDCADNQHDLTGVMELPNDFALSSVRENVNIYSEVGESLCIQTTGSNAKLGGLIYWAQF